MLKILTVIGARPQIIKASAISRAIRNHFQKEAVFFGKAPLVFQAETEWVEIIDHRAGKLYDAARKIPELFLTTPKTNNHSS